MILTTGRDHAIIQVCEKPKLLLITITPCSWKWLLWKEFLQFMTYKTACDSQQLPVRSWNLQPLQLRHPADMPKASPGAPELRMESLWVEELKRLTKHIFTMWYVRLLCRLGRKLSFTEVEYYPKVCSRLSDLLKQIGSRCEHISVWFRDCPFRRKVFVQKFPAGWRWKSCHEIA